MVLNCPIHKIMQTEKKKKKKKDEEEGNAANEPYRHNNKHTPNTCKLALKLTLRKAYS